MAKACEFYVLVRKYDVVADVNWKSNGRKIFFQRNAKLPGDRIIHVREVKRRAPSKRKTNGDKK